MRQLKTSRYAAKNVYQLLRRSILRDDFFNDSEQEDHVNGRDGRLHLGLHLVFDRFAHAWSPISGKVVTGSGKVVTGSGKVVTGSGKFVTGSG